MSRNRLKNSQSLHWMGVVKWVLIAGLLSVLGLSYMLCKNQNLHLAEETYRLEMQVAGIQKRNAELDYDLVFMKSPVRLQRRLAQMHSNLVRLGDAALFVVRMDQRMRAVVPPAGTMSKGGIDYTSYDSRVASATPLNPPSPSSSTP